MNKRFKSRVNIFKFLSIFILLIFVLIFPLFVQSLIKITKIECVSQYGVCPEGILWSLNQTVGKSLKTSKGYIKKTLNQNILVNSFLIQYKIPSTLKIELNLIKPTYAVKGIEEEFYLVDKNGLILDKTQNTNLPILYDKSFKGELGKNISEIELFSLKIIEKVSWLYSIKTGVLENNELKLTLKEGTLVRFPTEGDIDMLVGSLRLVFSRLNDGSQGIKMSDIREIDLRFKSVVLR